MTASPVASAIHTAFTDFQPRAVVFDCDGILLDTERMWGDTQNQVIADNGGHFSSKERFKLTGRSVRKIVDAIVEITGSDEQTIARELFERHRENLEKGIPLVPGALELVEAVRAKVPVAVVANSPRTWMQTNLERAGLFDLFDYSVSHDEVKRGKPRPDIYQRAAKLLGEKPKRCLAIEDTNVGARSAEAAGMRLLVVPCVDTQNPDGDLSLSTLNHPALVAWVNSWKPRR